MSTNAGMNTEPPVTPDPEAQREHTPAEPQKHADGRPRINCSGATARVLPDGNYDRPRAARQVGFEMATHPADRSDRVGRAGGAVPDASQATLPQSSNAQWPTPHARRPQHRSPHAGGPGARARKARWIHGERSAETMQRYRLYRPIKQLLGGGPREVELATKLWNLIKFKNEAG